MTAVARSRRPRTAGFASLQAVERAGPELLEALQLALSALRTELLCIMDGSCFLDDAGNPDRATLDEDVREPVETIEAAIEAGELAVLKASKPWDEIAPEDQWKILRRFPGPYGAGGQG